MVLIARGRQQCKPFGERQDAITGAIGNRTRPLLEFSTGLADSRAHPFVKKSRYLTNRVDIGLLVYMVVVSHPGFTIL